MRLYALEINDYSINDYYNYIYKNKDPNRLIFNAPNGDINNYYYSLDISIYVLKELLMFQFDDDVIKIKIFLQDLYDILDNKI